MPREGDPKDDKLKNEHLYKSILATVLVVRRPINLTELAALSVMPGSTSGNQDFLEELISTCGSFLTLRDRTLYFVHQSAKDFLLGNTSDESSRKAFNWIFSSGIEEIHHIIFSRSLDAMSTMLRRDIYGLKAPGFPIAHVGVLNPDPLAALRYPCVYWVDHLSASVSGDRGELYRDESFRNDGAVHTFLKTKYVY